MASLCSFENPFRDRIQNFRRHRYLDLPVLRKRAGLACLKQVIELRERLAFLKESEFLLDTVSTGLAESIRETDPTLPRYGTDCIQVARQDAAPFSY